MNLSMLDLFSGTGAASRAAEVRGWKVYRIDNAPDSNADLKMDLAKWLPWESETGSFMLYPANQWDLVWASPPCDLLTTVRSKGRDVEKGLELVKRAIAIITMLKPRWWVIENVHGATRAISSLIGPPVERYGSFYLWGNFPPFEARIPRNKTKLSGRRRAERRARIPWEISNGLIRACEKVAVELGGRLGASSENIGGPEGDPAGTRVSPSSAPTAAPAPFEICEDAFDCCDSGELWIVRKKGTDKWFVSTQGEINPEPINWCPWCGTRLPVVNNKNE